MARQRKFPIPTTNKEIPYDKKGFIKWSVEQQSFAETSAKQYADYVKTAYLTLFEENDTLFDNLAVAFTPKPLEEVPEKFRPFIEERSLLFDKIPDINDEYINLLDYCDEIERIDEYGEIYIANSDGEEVPIPKNDWLIAFKTYARYIKWRITEIYEDNCFPPLLATAPAINEPPITNKEFFDIPLKKEFQEYLKKLHRKQDPNWIPESEERNRSRPNTYHGENGVYSCISRLTKLYNLILIRRIRLDTLKNLKKSLQCKKRPRFTNIFIMLCKYIEWHRDDLDVISDQDVYYGCKTLEQYFDFMKEYSENPEKYERRPYQRKKKSAENKNYLK